MKRLAATRITAPIFCVFAIMLDPEFGHGNTPAKGERSRKLCHAISMAIERDEYSKIFPRRAGLAAISLVPTGIFDSRELTCAGLNPTTHSGMANPSLPAGGRAVRRPIEDAKALLTKGDHGDVCDERAGKCVFRRSVTTRFGIVTAEFGSVTDHFGDVTDGCLVPA